MDIGKSRGVSGNSTDIEGFVLAKFSQKKEDFWFKCLPKFCRFSPAAQTREIKSQFTLFCLSF